MLPNWPPFAKAVIDVLFIDVLFIDVLFIALVADITSVPAILSTPLFCMFKLWSTVTSPSKNVAPAIFKLFVKSHVSSASSNIKLACVTPSPLYTDIPDVVAVAVSGDPWVVFNCNILSSTSTVYVLIVVVVPLSTKLPVIVTSPAKVAFCDESNVKAVVLFV